MSEQKVTKAAKGNASAGQKIQQPKEGKKKERSVKSRAYTIYVAEHKDKEEFKKKGKKNANAKALGKAWKSLNEEEQEV